MDKSANFSKIYLILVFGVFAASAKIGGWDSSPNTQYHIQTDEGPERYFKFQTLSGQYRKEKRLQDGSVVGTYGWVDANGYLRLRDYVADDQGYRIVRTKLIKVGLNTPISDVVAATKAPYSKPIVVEPIRPTTESPKPLAPISLSDYLKQNPDSNFLDVKQPQVEVIFNSLPSSASTFSTTPAPVRATTPNYVHPQTYRPFYNPNSLDYNKKLYQSVEAGRFENSVSSSNNSPVYDGISLTHNGFRYYLPRQYHEEETLPGEKRSGSFGYIDPFGIRRVTYYNTAPGQGFVHRKNNRYVGFQSTPYDP